MSLAVKVITTKLTPAVSEDILEYLGYGVKRRIYKDSAISRPYFDALFGIFPLQLLLLSNMTGSLCTVSPWTELDDFWKSPELRVLNTLLRHTF